MTFVQLDYIPIYKIVISYIGIQAMPEQRKVNTIIKAADTLKSIAKEINQSLNISDNLGLSCRTTHRLLKTLRVAEFVFQDPITLRYGLGSFVRHLYDYSTNYHHNLIFYPLPAATARLRF